jgi:hypothetical protein
MEIALSVSCLLLSISVSWFFCEKAYGERCSRGEREEIKREFIVDNLSPLERLRRSRNGL